jgi:hypothetical protein
MKLLWPVLFCRVHHFGFVWLHGLGHWAGPSMVPKLITWMKHLELVQGGNLPQ